MHNLCSISQPAGLHLVYLFSYINCFYQANSVKWQELYCRERGRQAHAMSRCCSYMTRAPKLTASSTQTQICRHRQRGTIVTELITPFDFDDCSLHTQALHSVRVMCKYLCLLQPFLFFQELYKNKKKKKKKKKKNRMFNTSLRTEEA